jgi:hypothetical protein
MQAMRFLKPIIMTLLVAMSLTPVLAQKAPTQSEKVQGLRGWFGDTADKLKAAYNSNQEVEVLKGEKYASLLSLDSDGVVFFFDDKGKVSQIHLQQGFAGKVKGVGLGDSVAQMQAAAGRADKFEKSTNPNPAFPDAYDYALGDGVSAGFSVAGRSKSVTDIWLTLGKPGAN